MLPSSTKNSRYADEELILSPTTSNLIPSRSIRNSFNNKKMNIEGNRDRPRGITLK